MIFAQYLAAAEAQPLNVDVLDDLARSAIAEGEEAKALELVSSAARQLSDAHLWHWAGLLQRALDNHMDAFESLAEAFRLDNRNQVIAHAIARTALEAGWDSVERFETALQLGPPSSDILLGLTAARFARGEGDRAAAEISRILQEVPTWFDGHRQLAQLRSALGQRQQVVDSFEAALKSHPAEAGLWLALFDTNIAASEFEALDENIRRARAAGVSMDLSAYEAIAAGELGDIDRADPLFDRPDAPPIWHIRHFLRSGRAAKASKIVDAVLAGPNFQDVLPYAATVWRETEDERYSWLMGPDSFVRQYDLSEVMPPVDRLAELLRGLHRAESGYLDQSVRGGTQTDGPLFSRTEPEIRQLRHAIVTAVKRYLADLPNPDAGHPLLSPRRDRDPRFSGSWSVRLKGAGYHAPHVHTKGWISSALYVVLPEDDRKATATEKGSLELGAPPPDLNLSQAPLLKIEPRVGQLVLFPSWLWHGTRPFETGERITVAFDVGRPVSGNNPVE